MKKFIEINKWKLKLIGQGCFVVLLVLTTVLHFLSIADKPVWYILILLQFLFSFAFTLMLLIIIILNGYFYYHDQINFFNRRAVADFLKKYNFKKSLINENNFFTLTQEIQSAEISKYTVVVFQHYEKKGYVYAIVQAYSIIDYTAEQIKELKAIFNKENIEVDTSSIYLTTKSIEDLGQRVEQMLTLMAINNIS